jgi:hypothetical protein
MDQTLRTALRPAPPGAMPWALRLALALLLLALPGTPAGTSLLKPLLPAARAWMGAVEPSFAVRSLAVERVAGRERLRLEVALAHPVRVGGTVVMPHPRGRARAELPLVQVWQAPLLMAVLVLVWPAAARRELAGRAALAVPMAAVLLALDAPLVLLAEIWQLLRQSHGEHGFQALVAWAELLRAGGRAGLGLLAAAAVVGLVRPRRVAPG